MNINKPSFTLLWSEIVSTALFITLLTGCLISTASAQTTSKVLAWNNLGMHCMDDDFSVFAILPPYNVFHAQVVVGTNGTAHLASNTGGFQVDYQAVADADGSINTTSIRKSNFWEYVTPMLGASLPPDTGLALGPEYSPAAVMPGAGNPLQPMTYVSGSEWYAAWGVPITPYDDDLQLNPYPMMHVVTSGGGFASASTDIVLPVSTEMDCRACHASGSGVAARPEPDWEWNPSPTIDYRLNILRLHDQERFATVPAMYTNILSATGFNTEGLYASVVQDGRPVLCALCHLSEAVPGSGYKGLAPLTTVVHGLHANVIDPANGMTLGASSNRTSCYRCHPGEDTRCLRGAMGRAVAADGTLAIQCQDCHGGMTLVGDPARTGWLDEPTCQACHTGDALRNSGQIRYDNVFVTGTTMRDPANTRFATNNDAPLPGKQLYRFSRGHGGLYCSACHGSTHAIFPSAFDNDNVASRQHQNYEGTISECSSCHGSDTPAPSTNTFGGPHGMHRLNWVSGHKVPGKTLANCQPCHGTDYRGTLLSRSFKDQTLYGQSFWRGRRIGCYECHGGPVETGHPPAVAPTASNTTIGTMVNWPVNIGLTASTFALRIVSQPENGTVALNGTTATYIPANGFVGTDSFTFCSDSGFRESNLATVTVTVYDVGPCKSTLSSTDLAFDELSHVDEIQVTTAVDCPWTAASETLWVNLISVGGPGSGSVRFTMDRNTNSVNRIGYLSVAGKTVTVRQSGAPADTNGDGVPDSWQEFFFGLENANSPDAAPDFDYDLDGMTNLQEYLSGTNPTDISSVLRITSFSLLPTEPLFQLAFPSITQRYYQVQRTPDLRNPEWQGFTNAVIGTGATLPQSGPLVTNAERMFYRVLLVE